MFRYKVSRKIKKINQKMVQAIHTWSRFDRLFGSWLRAWYWPRSLSPAAIFLNFFRSTTYKALKRILKKEIRFLGFHLLFDNCNKSNKKVKHIPIMKGYFSLLSGWNYHKMVKSICHQNSCFINLILRMAQWPTPTPLDPDLDQIHKLHKRCVRGYPT